MTHVRFACCAGLVIIGGLSALAGPSRLVAGLAISPEHGLRCFSASFGRFDVGEVSKPVTRTVTLTNTGAISMTVVGLQPSCKCTSGRILQGGAARVLPLIVKPGAATRLSVTVDVAILKPGPFDKFLAVRVEGDSWAAATVEITGTVVAKRVA